MIDKFIINYLVTKTIPIDELKDYKDYIGFLFQNDLGNYNICDNEQEIIETNKWSKNLPLNTLIVSDEKIELGDRFLTLNGKTFKLISYGELDTVLLLDNQGKETVLSDNILKSVYKVIRVATIADKEKLVNGTINILNL